MFSISGCMFFCTNPEKSVNFDLMIQHFNHRVNHNIENSLQAIKILLQKAPQWLLGELKVH